MGRNSLYLRLMMRIAEWSDARKARLEANADAEREEKRQRGRWQDDKIGEFPRRDPYGFHTLLYIVNWAQITRFALLFGACAIGVHILYRLFGTEPDIDSVDGLLDVPGAFLDLSLHVLSVARDEVSTLVFWCVVAAVTLVSSGVFVRAILAWPRYRGWAGRLPFELRGDWWRLTQDGDYRRTRVLIDYEQDGGANDERIEGALKRFCFRDNRGRRAMNEDVAPGKKALTLWRTRKRGEASGEGNFASAYQLFLLLTNDLAPIAEQARIHAVTIEVGRRQRELDAEITYKGTDAV